MRNVAERKREVMKGAHNSTYTTHPRSTKMYHDIKTHFWWIGMKRDVVAVSYTHLTLPTKRIV